MDLTGIGSAADFARGVLDRIWPKDASEAEKLTALTELVPLVAKRDDAVAEAKKGIIVSEMEQGDNFTKRARPMVVYVGLGLTVLVHAIFPIIIKTVMMLMFMGMEATAIKALEASPAALEQLQSFTEIDLPREFWVAWGGICTTWVIGRSAERRGLHNRLLSMITGSKK